MKKTKISKLQCILAILFVTAHIISNITTVKQIALPFGFTTTCGAFVFPITYILSDVFSEVYGYKFSRFTCYMSFAMNIFATVIFALAIVSPYPVWWENQGAFATILGNTPRILIASLLAFIVGDFVNDKIFDRLKRKRKSGFAFRAIASSFCGQVVDSLIFIPIAFIGVMPLKDMALMMCLEITVKTIYETAVVPITAIIAKRTKRYEQRSEMNGE